MEHKKYDAEGSIQLAYFLKYGYLVLLFVSFIIVYFLNVSKLYYFILVGLLFIDSIHHFVAAYLFRDYYVCYVQSMNHSVMDPTIKYDVLEIRNMKKVGYGIGIIALVMGLIFTTFILL